MVVCPLEHVLSTECWVEKKLIFWNLYLLESIFYIQLPEKDISSPPIQQSKYLYPDAVFSTFAANQF